MKPCLEKPNRKKVNTYKLSNTKGNVLFSIVILRDMAHLLSNKETCLCLSGPPRSPLRVNLHLCYWHSLLLVQNQA